MMKKRIITFIVVAMLVLVYALPVSAHNPGPCNDSGEPGNSDYATHHIADAAKGGNIGGDGHVPGAHQGFSFCNPSGK